MMNLNNTLYEHRTNLTVFSFGIYILTYITTFFILVLRPNELVVMNCLRRWLKLEEVNKIERVVLSPHLGIKYELYTFQSFLRTR